MTATFPEDVASTRAENGPSRRARLTMPVAEPGKPTASDGAWWPRSRSLVAELPALITELRHRGFRTTRVAYHVDTWEDAPRKLHADGRVVRLGWFRSLDPHVVSLTGSPYTERVQLLVVPPVTPVDVAERMMADAGRRDGHGDTTATPEAAATRDVESPGRTAPDTSPVGPAAEVPQQRWESEGGRLVR